MGSKRPYEPNICCVEIKLTPRLTVIKLVKTPVLTSKTTSFHRYDLTSNENCLDGCPFWIPVFSVVLDISKKLFQFYTREVLSIWKVNTIKIIFFFIKGPFSRSLAMYIICFHFGSGVSVALASITFKLSIFMYFFRFSDHLNVILTCLGYLATIWM